MNKHEYIEALSKCLENVSESDKNEALEYCKQYFEEAGFENEQQAIKELGTPSQFAAQAMGTIAIKKDKEAKKKTTKGNIKTIWLVILGICAFPIVGPIIIAIAATLFAIIVSVLAILFSLIVVAIVMVVALGVVITVGIPVAGIPLGIGSVLFWQPPNMLVVIGVFLILIAFLALSIIIFYSLSKHLILFTKRIVIFVFNKIRGRVSPKTFYTKKKGDINNTYRVSENIKDIDIKAYILQFEIRRSNSIEHIEIEIRNFYSNDDLQYEVNAGRLSMSVMETEAKKIFSINKLVSDYAPKLILTLPSDYTFEKFSLHSMTAHFQIEHIQAKLISIANHVGKIYIRAIEAECVDITNNKGKIDISELKNTGNIKAINNVGETSIHLVNIEKYNYDAQNNVGSITIGNETSTKYGRIKKIGADLSQTLEVENNVGSVSIF